MLRRFASSLSLLQLLAFITLLRSVAFDRWITVLAASLLLIGAAAAKRGKTWGVALAFTQAIAFPTAVLIGIAPPWFAFVGMAGIMPFLHLLPAFKKFDSRATAVLASLGVVGGAGGALLWKAYAWDIIGAFPVLMPHRFLHHAPVLLAMIATALALRYRGRRKEEAEEARTRIAEQPESHVRIAGETYSDAELFGLEEVAEPEQAKRARVA